jgi:hypothetical protein
MDTMMDVLAVLDVDKSEISIGEEELLMNVMMKTLVAPLEEMDTLLDLCNPCCYIT